jgi:hypothetical protein
MARSPRALYKDLMYRSVSPSSPCSYYGPGVIPDTGCWYPWWGIPPYWPGPEITPGYTPGPKITPHYPPGPEITPGEKPGVPSYQPPGGSGGGGGSSVPTPTPTPPGITTGGGSSSAQPNPARLRIGHRRALKANPSASDLVPGQPEHAEYVRGEHDGVRNVYNPAGTAYLDAYDSGFHEAQRAATMKLRNPFWHTSESRAAGYPWSAPTLHERNYPTPGMFFDANNPDGAFAFTTFEALIVAALGSALSMAGANANLATDHGGVGTRLRRELRDLIQCSRWNDSLYGTSNMGFAGGADMLGPQGRGINWRPHHSNVFGTLSQGQTPARTTKIDGARLAQHMSANQLPLIWIPAVNLHLLSGPNPTVSVEGMTWTDGTPTSEPPPTVASKSVQMSGVVLPGGPGCPPSVARRANPRAAAPGGALAYWQRSATTSTPTQRRPSTGQPILYPQY